jgi:glycosyltransferase involved in cell wall biosynthesis
MLFSVIIPTYNRAALLCTALDSVFAQTFTDYEVIVVDDGSTDGTAAMVASYGGRVRYFQQQNKGPGAARNLGAQHATGEYLAFLDSDDLWFPWTLLARITISMILNNYRCLYWMSQHSNFIMIILKRRQLVCGLELVLP